MPYDPSEHPVIVDYFYQVLEGQKIMEKVMNGILIREVETKNIMTKSSLPVGGYSVNPYVG